MRTHRIPDRYTDEVTWFFHSRPDLSTERNIPQELLDIQDKWYKCAETQNDVGCCVLGAGMLFEYKDQWYCMAPASPFQGEGSWTPFVEFIKGLIEDAGGTKVKYYIGRMD